MTKHEYLHGACHALTIALSDLTGWQCVALFHDSDPFPLHSLVRRAADSALIAAGGIQTLETLMCRYSLNGGYLQEMKSDQIAAIYGLDDYELEEATKYAKRLLSRIKASASC